MRETCITILAQEVSRSTLCDSVPVNLSWIQRFPLDCNPLKVAGTLFCLILNFHCHKEYAFAYHFIHLCMLSHFRHGWFFVTLWTVARQAPLSMYLFLILLSFYFKPLTPLFRELWIYNIYNKYLLYGNLTQGSGKHLNYIKKDSSIHQITIWKNERLYYWPRGLKAW